MLVELGLCFVLFFKVGEWFDLKVVFGCEVLVVFEIGFGMGGVIV